MHDYELIINCWSLILPMAPTYYTSVGTPGIVELLDNDLKFQNELPHRIPIR